MINPQWLGLFYCVSEVFISRRMRSGQSQDAGNSKDRGSLRWIWIVVMGSVTASIAVMYAVPLGRMTNYSLHYWIGICLFVAFIALRWYAIYYLGNFFTVDVAVVADQHVINTGPYRFIRHPSYLGAIGAFLGLGLTMNNWIALIVLVVPITAVFLHRITVEESALQAGLGDAYTQYMKNSWRLVPGLY